MKTTQVLLCSLLFLAANGNHDSTAKHQERNNRMVPDFQPFQHPANKIQSSGSLSSKSGPISDVEWVEEVMPVFGKMYTMPKREKEGQGSMILIFFGLILGGLIVGAFFKSKADENKKTDRIVEDFSHERNCEPQKMTKVEPNETANGATENVIDKKVLKGKNETRSESPCESTYNSIKMVKEINYQKNEFKVMDKTNDVKLNEERTDIKEVRVTNIPRVQVNGEVIEEETAEIKVIPNNTTAEKDLQTAKVQIPRVHVNGELIEEERAENKVITNNTKAEKDLQTTKVKPSQVPLSKRKISQATSENFEDPEWITKIKTFKITKYPKTNNADICEHGATQSAVDVLDIVELQKAEDMKTTIQTATAELNIEGANTSRLRITVVVDNNEEESLAKTMTIKEFMVSISNQIIEDAVRRVREECSMDNIKHLAETIKKYRPESAEIKKVKSL